LESEYILVRVKQISKMFSCSASVHCEPVLQCTVTRDTDIETANRFDKWTGSLTCSLSISLNIKCTYSNTLLIVLNMLILHRYLKYLYVFIVRQERKSDRDYSGKILNTTVHIDQNGINFGVKNIYYYL